MITVTDYTGWYPTPQVNLPTTYICQPWITTTTTVPDPRVAELEDRVAELEHEILATRLGFRLPEGVQVDVDPDGAGSVFLTAEATLSENEWTQVGEYLVSLRARRLTQKAATA